MTVEAKTREHTVVQRMEVMQPTFLSWLMRQLKCIKYNFWSFLPLWLFGAAPSTVHSTLFELLEGVWAKTFSSFPHPKWRFWTAVGARCVEGVGPRPSSSLAGKIRSHVQTLSAVWVPVPNFCKWLYSWPEDSWQQTQTTAMTSNQVFDLDED